MRFKTFHNHIMMEAVVYLELGQIHRDDFDEYFQNVVPDDAFKNSVYIDDINVDRYERNKGHFSRAISKLIHDMNIENKFIFLHAYPYESRHTTFERDQKRLIETYELFGFVHVGQGWMYKEPK